MFQNGNLKFIQSKLFKGIIVYSVKFYSVTFVSRAILVLFQSIIIYYTIFTLNTSYYIILFIGIVFYY